MKLSKMKNRNNAVIKDPGTITQRNKIYTLRSVLYNFLINFLLICLLIIIVGLVVFGTMNGNTNIDYTEEMDVAESDVRVNVNAYYKGEKLPNGYFLLGYNYEGNLIKNFCDAGRFKTDSLKGNWLLNTDETKVYGGQNYISRTIKLEPHVEALQYVKILMPTKEYNLSALIPEKTILGVSISIFVVSIIGALALALMQVMQNYKSQLATNKFASDISHELNTPLSIIQSNIQSLLDEPNLTIEEGSGKLVNSAAEVTRLRKMSKQLLILSRCDNSKLSVEYKDYDLIEEMQLILEPYQLIAEMQDKKFEVHFAENIPEKITFDKDLLIQILTALLDNAIKYTQAGEGIYVKFAIKQNNLEFSVGDTGAGVDEKDLDKIFNRFYRTDKSRTSEGTGLGLAIVHAIVVALKGKILAKNLKPQGFEVQISLPIKAR